MHVCVWECVKACAETIHVCGSGSQVVADLSCLACLGTRCPQITSLRHTCAKAAKPSCPSMPRCIRPNKLVHCDPSHHPHVQVSEGVVRR